LRHDARLDAAAASLARGGALASALKAAGYRATRSYVISVSGATTDDTVTSLVRREYCKELAASDVTDMGVRRDGTRVFIVLAAPFAPRVSQSTQEAGRRVLALVNEARATPRSCGGKPFAAAKPLRWNEVLAVASLMHADDMADHDYFSHDGRDGSTPAQRVARAGYRYRMTGENIAAGPTRPEDAVSGWIKSPPHCANLMNPDFTEMGAAYAVNAKSSMGVYWVQEFGTRR
jgi:uncharacterized protein YkwD